MTQNFTKKILFLIVCLVGVSFGFASTGIEDFMPTMSGDYVYYRDYTFHTKTYVGFVFYDENTYGMRYYAVNPKVGSEEVELLVTLNPNKDVVEISGEKIITQTVQADIESVNYLHELLYEFSARRKKQNGNISSNTLVVSDDFQQFGGQMTVTYDAYVPIFNLSAIKDKSGKALLEVQSIGRLADSNDNSFFDFKVTDSLLEENSMVQNNALKQGNSQKVIFDTISITLDESWERKLENFWTLNDDALLSITKMVIPTTDFANNAYTVQDYFKRQFLLSGKGSALLLPKKHIDQTEQKLAVNALVFTREENMLSRQIQILLQSSEKNEDYYLLSFTVYESAYQANKVYFDRIINSIQYIN